MSYTGVKPTAPVSVACGPVLAQVYGLVGQTVSLPVKVVSSLDQKPVAGANIYVFDTAPYGWGQSQQWTLASSMILGQTPVTSTGTQGNGTIQVTIPSGDQRSVQYVIVTAPGYWTEFYTLTTGFNPLFSASSEQQCIQLYPYSTVQNILNSLVQVQLQNVLNGKTYSLNNVQLEPIGYLLPSTNVLSFGVSEQKYAAKLQAYYAGIVNGGNLRIVGIKFRTLGNLQDMGVQQLSVKIVAGGQTLFDGVLFNSLNSNLPLGSGQQNTTYTVNVGGNLGVVDLPQGATVQIQVNAVANTAAEAGTEGAYLHPRDNVLEIQLLLADPMQNRPIVFTVQG
jgi:hypothetical protein